MNMGCNPGATNCKELVVSPQEIVRVLNNSNTLGKCALGATYGSFSFFSIYVSYTISIFLVKPLRANLIQKISKSVKQ
jgi:hypothetical protein